MTRKLFGLIAFVATGLGLMLSTVSKDMNLINGVFLLIIGFFFTVSLKDHFHDLIN